MLKLLLCLFCSVATAVALLELREQRLNLTFDAERLHNQIETTQAQLWNEQLSIAISTAPNAVAASAKGQDLQFAGGRSPDGKRSWIDDPDAAQ